MSFESGYFIQRKLAVVGYFREGSLAAVLEAHQENHDLPFGGRQVFEEHGVEV